MREEVRYREAPGSHNMMNTVAQRTLEEDNEQVGTIQGTACPLLSARVVIRLSHRLHKGCNFFWSLSREKTGGERGEEGREHCEAI